MSDQEGDQLQWSNKLRAQSRDQLEALLSASAPNATPIPESEQGIFRGLGRQEIIDLNAAAHRERTRLANSVDTDSVEFEIWSSNAEGAYRVTEIQSEPVPKTLTEAMNSTYWPLLKAAMEEEVKGKLANGAWIVVRRPTDATVHKSRWVFDIKFYEDGSIRKAKARFVGCGYSMIKEEHYEAVFAATLPGVSFRLLLAFIAMECLETDHIDAVKAFTQADIDKKVYVEMPEGFDTRGWVLLLLKALEGIKQGAALWFAHNRAAWLKLGFTSWMNEPNLYWHKRLGIRVGVFADDTLAGYPKSVTREYMAIKAQYAEMINIGSVTISPVIRFTGANITRDRDAGTITVNQTEYIWPRILPGATRSTTRHMGNRKRTAPALRGSTRRKGSLSRKRSTLQSVGSWCGHLPRLGQI